jgi:hypothetical protein
MRLTLLFCICVCFAACGTNRAVYKSADFEQQAARHQTIAILPVCITETGYVSKKVSEADIKAANEKWSYVFQESLHAYVLRETSKNKKGAVVSFQALQKTNALLREANLTIDDIYGKQPEELAKLLQVDAVLSTTLQKNKNFSDGVAYGLAAGRTIFNILGQGTSNPLPWINASDIYMSSSLYNAGDSKLLWKTSRKGGTDLPTNVDDLVQYYSGYIAKKIPYRS